VTARVTWGLAVYPEDGTSQRALTSVADSRLMQRKFEGRPVSVGVARPASGRLIESDPEKLRIVRGLLDLISEKDPVTAQRSQRVASFALLVADELSLSEQERYELWLGSLLHDLGQVGTPDVILQRAGPMTPEEWDVVRRHAALGEQVVRGMLSSEVVSAVVGCHHERYDGLGYPRGLAGEEIPRMARIVAVADAFAAMVDDRPHAPKMSWPEAMIELGRHAGTQFDPAIVNAFLRAVGQSSVRAAA
jgi:HD-GYP domain-containing protein (c-di-GMP phosphodiesterase class II)